MEVFLKDTVLHGQPVQIKCIEIAGQRYVFSEGFLKIVQLEDEWYADVKDPDHVVTALRENAHIKADLFTFRQRLPDMAPRYPYRQEWENIAVLTVKSFDDWWKNCIKKGTRYSAKKSEKMGVEVRETTYDDEFVRGMTKIFNESPVRQGRPFFHYGKDFETVKRQFARFIYQEKMIGAYFEGELIGFVMLGIGDNFAQAKQIISYIKHRDKSPNIALIAKAVEICEREKLPYLSYGRWTDDSLSEFKSHCGFRKTGIPRYYIPLTLKGALALALGLHRGWRQRLPKPLIRVLKKIRKIWFAKRAG